MKFFEDFKNIQKELQTIERTAEGYNYKYTDLPTIWKKTRDIITKNNFIVMNEISDNAVTTIALHKDGEKLTSTIELNRDLKPQDKGSEISYYRRYNLSAIFNIITGDDDDDAKTANKAPQIATPQVKPQDVSKMTIEELEAYWKANATSLTEAQKQEVIAKKQQLNDKI